MSGNTCIAEAINFTPTLDQDQIESCPYCEPSEAWLKEAGLTPGRYREEMEAVLECYEFHLRPSFNALNELPECPDLKVLKSGINAVFRAPFIKPQNPSELWKRITYCLVEAHLYDHRLHTKRSMQSALERSARDLETLKPIDPQNVNQKRAMVLLTLLKAKPDEALHTEDCKRILEGSEGTALDSKVVRRAMEFLAELYNPVVVYEKLGGSYRIHANV